MRSRKKYNNIHLDQFDFEELEKLDPSLAAGDQKVKNL